MEGKVWMIWVASLAIAAVAAGQEDPEGDPELSDRSIDEVVRDMVDRPGEADTISPRQVAEPRPAAPGQMEGPLLPGLDGFGLGPARVLPEDSFLSRRPGRLLRLSSGDWAFVFYRGVDEAGLQPMIVLPCRELQRAEAGIVDPSDGGEFQISGRVFVYRARNYILPNASRGLVAVQAQPEAGSSEDGVPAATSALEPDIASIVEALEAERASYRPLAPVEVEQEASVEGFGGALEEGTFIVRRRGRLTRLSTGEWAFAIESGADGNPALDPPMVITPSMNLASMEFLTSLRGADMTIELTGQTLMYKRRAYVVPLMYQVLLDRQVRPLQ